MSLGRIDVEVTDAVAPSIQTKIDGIADSADKAQSAIDKLSAKLKSLDAQPFVALAKAYSILNDEVNKANKSYLDQENALNKAITAEANAKRATDALASSQAAATAKTVAAASANQKLADSHISVYNALQKERAAQTASNAQTDFNALLGVTDNKSSGAAKASAAVFAEAFALEASAAKKAAAEIKAADVVTEHFGFTTARSKTELLVLAHELTQGRYRNFGQSIMVLGEQTGVMGVAFTAAGLSIIGAGAALALFIYYANAGSAVTASLNRTLAVTNNYAGLTTDGLYAMAASVGTLTKTSTASSLAIAQSLTATGQLQANQVRNLTASVQLLSKFTGQSTDKIIKDFSKAADAPAKYAEELDKSLNFLSTAQLEELKALEERGNKTEALTKFSTELYDYLKDKAPPALSPLTEGWHALTKAISDANTAAKEAIDPQTTQGKIAQIERQLEEAKANAARSAYAKAGGIGIGADINAAQQASTAVQALLLKLGDIREQQNAAEKAVGEQAASVQVQKLGKEALDSASKFKKYATDVNGAANEIADLHKIIGDLLAADPASKIGLQFQANEKAMDAAIKKSHESRVDKKADNAEATRAAELAKFVLGLKAESDAYGLVGDERERLLKIDALSAKFVGSKKSPLSSNERADLDAQIKAEQVKKRIDEAGNALDQYVNGPQRAFDAAQDSAAVQLFKGTIGWDDYKAAVSRAEQTLARAKDPLYDTIKAIGDQEALYGQYGDALQLATQLQSAQNTMLAQGKTLYDAETGALNAQGKALEKRYAELNKNQQVDKLIGQIWQDNIGAAVDLEKQIQAHTEAFNQGFESAERYAIALNNIRLKQDQLKVNNGTASFADAANASLEKFQSSYKGVAAGATEAFGNFFDTFASGAADAFGKAITGQETFKQAIEQTAQQALSSLISALIKIGIQYLINAALGETAATTTAAASAELASATAIAWAPAAALVNAATFGAGADAADVSLPVTFGVAEAIAMGSFQIGGYTGNLPTNQIAGVVHGQEHVMNAAATARNRPVLEAMNRGATFAPTGSGNSAGGPGKRPAVDVHNYTGTSVRVEQDDDNTRILIGQELQKQLPKAMGNEVTKPNSPFNKNLRKFTNTKRRVS